MITLNQSKNIQLSENFTLFEFLDSSSASRLKLHQYQEQITEKDVLNLKRLCENILQPLRDYSKEPISISSGYRSPQLNRAIGGAKQSDHMTGKAADIQTKNLDFAFGWIKNNCKFKQLILEQSGYKRWIHVSYDEFDNRGEVLLFIDGKYIKQ